MLDTHHGISDVGAVLDTPRGISDVCAMRQLC